MNTFAENLSNKMPPEVRGIISRLHDKGFQVYLVGGVVRDCLLGLPPADWDVVTDALPEQVLEIFPGSKADDIAFGRVLVDGVDVLTMRKEGEYKDFRRPSKVVFTNEIEEDLARRDFTINAIAYDPFEDRIIDPKSGMFYLKTRIIHPVNSNWANEDALRILRAVRFWAILGFDFSDETRVGIRLHRDKLQYISHERIRDEFSKILLSIRVPDILEFMVRVDMLDYILPSFSALKDIKQPAKYHVHNVFTHSILTCHYISPILHLRLAGLLHDIGKICTYTENDEGEIHFYDHDKVGSEVARVVLDHLMYSNEIKDRVLTLIKYHMFGYTLETKISAMRRLISKLGEDIVRDLLELKRADKLASGKNYQTPILDKLMSDFYTVLREESAFHMTDLAVNGDDVMRVLSIPPGPTVGKILKDLHELVLENPELNRRDILLTRMKLCWRQDG